MIAIKLSGRGRLIPENDESLRAKERRPIGNCRGVAAAGLSDDVCG
ncbi:MAG: hypothetical protein Q8Q80_07875 [Methyloversatilis sp.]|nr:hypothetical protein [Methyloversatilis sp.]MDP3872566.1 hypothetical protein [Methyloversatilis sp.]